MILKKKVDGYDKMLSFLDEFEIPYTLINTDNKNIDEVFEEADEVVRKKIKEVKGEGLIKRRF